METNMEQNYVKGFKVFNPDWSCGNDNGDYFKQYACPGTFEEDIVPKVCRRGMHFCVDLADCFDYYRFSPDNKVAEVIALGDVSKVNTCCTNKLQIVRELSWDEVLKLVNTGDGNIGRCNMGDYNSGHGNKGNYNYGHCNVGNHNGGCHNAGDYNRGECNTGNYNSGKFNVGDWNSGRSNEGCFNTNALGFFNTKFRMFNKKTDWTLSKWRQSEACRILESMPQSRLTWICFGDMTDEEKLRHPYAETTGGCLRMIEVTSDTRQQWWNSLPESDKKEIMSLPNFDADIFFEITGIIAK